MKQNKRVTIALIFSGLIIAGTVIFLWLYDKKEKIKGSSETTGSTPTVSSGSAFPLKIGSTGEKVKELQRKLNEVVKRRMAYLYVKPTYLGVEMDSIAVDGIFGPRTLVFLQYAYSDSNKIQITETEFNKLS
ncbi:MAG: hypothetical protein VB046_06875 [Paludibacter sp.]|nr:hypothetical protein [Paludibacter sp.]